MEAEGRQVPLPGRWRYRFDRTLARSTARLMGWLVVSCLAVVVPVSALLVWTDPASPRSLVGRLEAVWRTSAQTLRLGEASGTPLRMALSALLGLVALLCVSTLVGVITAGLEKRLTELSRGRSTVLEQGHAVVLGWSDQVFTVVAELLAAQGTGSGRRQRGRPVVLLADRDKTEMERALAARVGAVARGRVICRSGPASDPAVLALVSPRTAGTVLVLPSGEPTGDAEVLRTLLALRAVLGAEVPGPPVLAAVGDDRFRAPARLAAGPRGTVLEADTVTARLIAQCVGRPGLSLVLRDLLDFAGDEFHLADASAFHGRPFGTALLGHANACVAGLFTEDGRTVLNPAAETVVEPGSRLIVVAGDEYSARAEDCRRLVDPSARAVTTAPAPDPARLLLLGWNRRAPLVIAQLRDTAHPGSVLDVVTEEAVPAGERTVPGQTRETGAGSAGQMRETGAGVPGKVREDGAGVPGKVREDGAGVPGKVREDGAGVPGAGRLEVRFRSAALSRPETLLGLDLSPYDAVVVLGPDAGTGPDRPDDRTLVTLLGLRLVEQRTGRDVRVVTELTDDRNRPLAPLNPGSDVVVSGELTGLLMAQIAQNPHLAAVFEELFSAEGSGISLRPAGHYVRAGTTATFATVVAAARDRGECAIGYRRRDQWAVSPAHGVRLNPPKDERREWSAEDQVVVVATEFTGGAADGVTDGAREERVGRQRMP
ncbi:NAD-binding lipoprotein [Streptomyces sp. NPDC007084]|uniref:CASTOR/POLLUX-related putative ion channel n=1 Tax=Streptomyces sp. NPDC007084 TaxID=3154313 RepID=UPI003456AFB5